MLNITQRFPHVSETFFEKNKIDKTTSMTTGKILEEPMTLYFTNKKTGLAFFFEGR
jgi:hypothetical protein